MAPTRPQLLAAAVLALSALLPTGHACATHYWRGGRLLSEVSEEGLPAYGGSPSDHSPHFSYIDQQDWPGECTKGQRQSPIGVQTSTLSQELPPEARAQLQFGVAKGLRIFNTGHHVQVEWDSLEGVNASVVVPGNAWASLPAPNTSADAQGSGGGSSGGAGGMQRVPLLPLQIHWHSTSEHLVDGDSAPLELHIVTRVDNTTGAPVPDACRQAPCLAVFGVMAKFRHNVYKPGAPLYDLVLNSVPDAVGAQAATNLPSATLNLTSLLPADLTYATYSGSLTTPPCDEGVLWHLFLQPKRDLSAAQLEEFQVIVGSTVVDVSAECPAEGAQPQGSTTAGTAGAAPAPSQEGGDEATLACRAPSGGRTNNRDIQPVGDRAVLVSTAA